MEAKNDRIICEIGIMPEKLQSGLYAPDAAVRDGQAKINVGRVLKFGPGFKLTTGEWVQGYDGQEGDVICWEQFSAVSYEILKKGLVCIRNSDVGCTLEKGEYEGYYFDQAVVDKINAKDEEERRLRFVEEKETAVEVQERECKYFCKDKDCKGRAKIVTIKSSNGRLSLPNCEYCGIIMDEVE